MAAVQKPFGLMMGRLIPTESTSIVEVLSVLLSRSVNKKLGLLAEDLSISQG